MSRTDQFLKWIGVVALGAGLGVVAIAARDLPGIVRELKIARMGFVGGWKQAH